MGLEYDDGNVGPNMEMAIKAMLTLFTIMTRHIKNPGAKMNEGRGAREGREMRRQRRGKTKGMRR